MREILVRSPGMLTTVQDAGRFGYQARGVPPAGALDLDSLEMANFLVGNERWEAALECTLAGPELEFAADTVFAIAGAPMGARLNGIPVPPYETRRAEAGDLLSLGPAEAGVRAYLAFRGGFDLPLVMGSRSTYARGGFGGYLGRQLRAGDRVPLRGAADPRAAPARSIPEALRPRFPAEIELRALPSHEADRFAEGALELFFSTGYRVSAKSDRMGCRLEGAALAHSRGADVISEGLQTGTVQIPGDGRPIVLLADRQTTGGYTRIAHVLRVDLPRLGQARAGDLVRFRRSTLEEARAAILEREGLWDRLTRANEGRPERTFRILVGGREYLVGVSELPG